MTWWQFTYWFDNVTDSLTQSCAQAWALLLYTAQIHPRWAIGITLAVIICATLLVLTPARRPPASRRTGNAPPATPVIRTCAHGVPVDTAKLHFCAECALDASTAAEIDRRLRARRASKLHAERLATDTHTREAERLRRTLLLSQDELQAMPANQFAEEIADMFIRLGYDARLLRSDVVGDMLLRRQQQRWLLRCTTAPHTPIESLELFLAAMFERELTAGFYVTAGEFPEAALAFGKSAKIEMIDGPMLLALMRRSKPDATSDDGYDVICNKCAATIRHRLRIPKPRRCRCGNLVPPTLKADQPMHESGLRLSA